MEKITMTISSFPNCQPMFRRVIIFLKNAYATAWGLIATIHLVNDSSYMVMFCKHFLLLRAPGPLDCTPFARDLDLRMKYGSESMDQDQKLQKERNVHQQTRPRHWVPVTMQQHRAHLWSAFFSGDHWLVSRAQWDGSKLGGSPQLSKGLHLAKGTRPGA